MNKHFKEVVTHRALDFKLSGCPGVFLEVKEQPEVKFKNVCAPISLDLNNELENSTGLLNLSKREFLALAIESAIDDAKNVIHEVDVFEHEIPSTFSSESIMNLSEEEKAKLAEMSDSERSVFMSAKFSEHRQAFQAKEAV